MGEFLPQRGESMPHMRIFKVSEHIASTRRTRLPSGITLAADGIDWPYVWENMMKGAFSNLKYFNPFFYLEFWSHLVETAQTPATGEPEPDTEQE
jgi:hypothetical protein